jgi:hypothetical protein
MQHKARIREICKYVKWNRKYNSREKTHKVLHLKEKGKKKTTQLAPTYNVCLKHFEETKRTMGANVP